MPALTRERDVREAYAAHSGELYGFAVRSLGDAGLAEEAVQETFCAPGKRASASIPRSAACAPGCSRSCATW
jgi:RNA polymerase sigma-70 factor, ECF subfamily